jgi:hypothetical protein
MFMKVRKYLFSSSLLLLAACGSAVTTATDGQVPEIIDELPESVVAIAASYQNLDAVRLMPDGCYWYSRSGPVETTLLPLRTDTGNPICARAPAPHEPPATG